MVGMVEVTQPLSYSVDELWADVRPLRAQFELLALALQEDLLRQGMATPLLEAALDLQYVGQGATITVSFPLEIEDAAVCLADPLPLDAQALRVAVEAFHVAHEAQYGYALRSAPVQVTMLRVRTQIQSA
jgi:hypothetical protein